MGCGFVGTKQHARCFWPEARKSHPWVEHAVAHNVESRTATEENKHETSLEWRRNCRGPCNRQSGLGSEPAASVSSRTPQAVGGACRAPQANGNACRARQTDGYADGAKASSGAPYGNASQAYDGRGRQGSQAHDGRGRQDDRRIEQAGACSDSGRTAASTGAAAPVSGSAAKRALAAQAGIFISGRKGASAPLQIF